MVPSGVLDALLHVKSWPKRLVYGVVALVLVVLLYSSMTFPSYVPPPAAEPPAKDLTVSSPATPPTSFIPAVPVIPAITLDPTKLAFMVETRPLPHLPALFLHMSTIIPPEWTFLFMGSPESIAFMRTSPSLQYLETTQRLRFTTIPTNYSMKDRESISQMFTDPHLYDTILVPAEHLLVFQPDAIFCANSEQSLNDYLEYDWIGAPWGPDWAYGGNGGLNLRKVSKILEVLNTELRVAGDGRLEDAWLSDRISRLPGAKMASANVAKHFSVESVWDESPLGYHIGWLGVHHPQIWDDQRQVDRIFEYCPEISLIVGMKLDTDKPKGIP